MNYRFTYWQLSRSHSFVQGTTRGGLESFRDKFIIVPGWDQWSFFTPSIAGVDFQGTLVASCFLDAILLVDLRAVYLVLVQAKREISRIVVLPAGESSSRHPLLSLTFRTSGWRGASWKPFSNRLVVICLV
ncbi:hypothetical protein Acr_24g0017700 [Actinidia rufa]|uniref:Uncharacterized protein n=1 Tax=Actinidia rufa TaxID=165716 RepID=A0A7J0GXM7_9ERIC|nr:hypothetical protein Acr_24g0017700 [Actinidia rufa]